MQPSIQQTKRVNITVICLSGIDPSSENASDRKSEYRIIMSVENEHCVLPVSFETEKDALNASNHLVNRLEYEGFLESNRDRRIVVDEQLFDLGVKQPLEKEEPLS
jgi:hypothetical protein